VVVVIESDTDLSGSDKTVRTSGENLSRLPSTPVLRAASTRVPKRKRAFDEGAQQSERLTLPAFASRSLPSLVHHVSEDHLDLLASAALTHLHTGKPSVESDFVRRPVAVAARVPRRSKSKSASFADGFAGTTPLLEWPAPEENLSVAYRNNFSVFELRLPAGVGTAQIRVYLDDLCQYTGKAKRIKARPDANETALVISASLRLPTGEPVTEQCDECYTYFRQCKLFATNPAVQRRALMVKHSESCRVIDGVITVRAKVLCASRHRNVSHFVIDFGVSDTTGTKIAVGEIAVNVKQWKKGAMPIDTCHVDLSRV